MFRNLYKTKTSGGAPMYIIAGLGNPGKEYEMTRHNIGFHTVDYIAEQAGIRVKKLKFKGLYGDGSIAENRLLLIKPQTYMNLSGECIGEFASFYKIPPENVIIISDDISLTVGKIRVRAKGSAGGHNGLKSIIAHLNSDKFIRIRIGVGDRTSGDLANHVLGRFKKDEIPVMEKAIINANGAISEILKNGVESAMNKYNGSL